MSESENVETRYWKIAPGAGAWQWEEWREGSFVAIGWEDLGDVSRLTRADFDARRDELIDQREDWTKQKLNQVWDFSRISEGDRVVANQGKRKVLGIGIVVGPYEFVPDAELGHRLPVQWNDLTPREVHEGSWAKALMPLNREKFDMIQEAPPVIDDIDQQSEPVLSGRKPE